MSHDIPVHAESLRVLGTDGQPLAGAPVWAEDLTFVGKTHDGFLTLEHEMAGKSDQWMNRWLHVRADDQGLFELAGLSDRPYQIAALDPATGLVGRVESVMAGSSDVVVAMSPGGLWERVAGRVVDSHGQPLAGVQVQALRATFRVRSFQGSLWHGSEPVDGAVVLTDADGRFQLGSLSKEGVILELWGSTFSGLQRELRPDEDPAEIQVVVPWLGHLQVELAGAAPSGGRIELLDRDGRAVEFFVFGGGDVWTRRAIDLDREQEFTGGRTPVLSVPDSATAVVLRDAQGNELRRVPLTLGDDLTTVKL